MKKKKKRKRKRSPKRRGANIGNHPGRDAQFKKGHSVVVRNGVKEPYYGEDISGWQGRIRQIEKTVEGVARFEIEWDSVTLKGMPEEYIEKCHKDAHPWDSSTLWPTDVEPCKPRDRRKIIPSIIRWFREKFSLRRHYWRNDFEREHDYTTRGFDIEKVIWAPKGSEPPTRDFLKKYNLENRGEIEFALEDFLSAIRKGEFKLWRIVEDWERGMALAGEDYDVLLEMTSSPTVEPGIVAARIDGLARPSEPWWEIARKIAAALVMDEYRTSEYNYLSDTIGGHNLMEVLKKLGSDLALPDGVSDPVEVVPREVRCRLRLQFCFDVLMGVGQDPSTSLKEEGQKHRLELFVKSLRKCKDCVRRLDLTIERLLEMVILPREDREILVRDMLKRLGMSGVEEKLADYL